MTKTAKIAISLPQELLRSIELERSASGETRSELFRRAVEDFLRRRRERDAVDRYVRGYQQHPETEEEAALAESTAQRALGDNPWDEGAKG